jgi:hypothetical protein
VTADTDVLLALYSTLKLLVNEIWSLERFGNDRLAKYLRLLFQAVLPLDGPAALQIIDQAREIVRQSAEVRTSGEPAASARFSQ